jgi:aminopeptidase N
VPGIDLTREEAAGRAAVLQVEAYEIDLDLAAGPDTFRSTTTVRFGCSRPGGETFIDLIAPTVHRVVLNGRDLDVDAVVSTGRIRLPELAAGNELLVEADCAYMHSGEGLHRFCDPVDGAVYLYSQFEVADARRVFCCFDQPDLKASHRFTVTAPADWQVVSCSPTPDPEPTGTGPDGTARSTWRFSPTPRLSTYVTAIVAGPYHAVRGELTSSDGRTIPLGVFCRRSLAEHLDADNVMDITRAGFCHYEVLFDLPYPFEKYDQLFVPEFNAGAMENAGAVTITEHYLFRSRVPAAAVERRALTLIHELSHMWFGDLVTMRWWDDLWLNESFAEYTSTRCQVEATQWRTAWTTFTIAEKSWAYRQDQLASTHPIAADIRTLSDVEVNFDGITYAKGASVLKQLVHWVGQEAFDVGTRRYFRKHAWGNTTLTDLLVELGEASGRDLEQWAKLWLQTAGVATLVPEIAVEASGTVTAAAVLQQIPASHPVLRPHRLAVGCYDLIDGRLQRTHRVELDVDGARTAVPDLVGRPRPALLLLNDDDLAYAKIRMDDASMSTALEHLGAFEDSLPRSLVWGAAWDMTRDGELDGRTFVDLVLRHIASVDDPSVAQTLLRQTATTLENFVAVEHRAAARNAAAARLLELFLSASAGSDLQLLLARALAGTARSGAELAAVGELLAGTLTVEGLQIDTELRWILLESLVVGGAADEEAIAAELRLDDTSGGRVHAACARAAIPTVQAKAAAWRTVVEQQDLPNAEQAAVIGGFGRVDDVELLRPFVEPYFACLERVWAERTREMGGQIVVGLFPSALAGDDVLARTDAWLESARAEPALRRLVIEGRDGVVRSLRAQERDRAEGGM